MAVVINEFEVVGEPPPARTASRSPEGNAPATSELQKAEELARLITRHRERLERLRAH